MYSTDLRPGDIRRVVKRPESMGSRLTLREWGALARPRAHGGTVMNSMRAFRLVVPSTYSSDRLTPPAAGIRDGAHPRTGPQPPCPGSPACRMTQSGSATGSSRVSAMGQGQVKSLSPRCLSRGGFHWVFRHVERKPADRKSAGASDAPEAPVLIGGPSRTRTVDPLIKSQLLYQLS